MNVYCQSLRAVVVDEDLQPTELPHTIKEDIAVMKRNLEERECLQCLLDHQDIIVEAWEYIANISIVKRIENCLTRKRIS